MERAGRSSESIAGDVFKRGKEGLGGGGRGAINLSLGFIVLAFSSTTEFKEALRPRQGWISTGTQRRLSGWPGRYGQEVVEGMAVSWTSVPSSSSYYISYVNIVLISDKDAGIRSSNMSKPSSNLPYVWSHCSCLHRKLYCQKHSIPAIGRERAWNLAPSGNVLWNYPRIRLDEQIVYVR